MEPNTIQIFYNSGRCTEKGINLHETVDLKIAEIFSDLVNQGVSINDAYLLLNMSLFDARLDKVMDDMYPTSEDVPN